MSSPEKAELVLDELEGKLRSHFEDLASKRGVEKPVFAIEHGLDQDTRHNLSENIKAFSTRYRPHSVHRLCWIVFASEIGYQFDGMDYWEPFEAALGCAFSQTDRQTIKRYFLWFQKGFNGVVPEGAWAEHRSIISWPVTHALIPRSLQEIFVGHLFRNRRFLTGDIGQEMKRTRYQVADRYQYFFEQTSIVEKLARAIILHQPETRSGDETFNFDTLTRLIKDLESYEYTKEWIRKVRDQTRTGFRTPSSIDQSGKVSDPDLDDPGIDIEPIQRSEKLGCWPQLTHKPDGRFGLSLRFSGFTSIAETDASIRDFLKKYRVTVAGSGGKRNPPGWLIFGSPSQAVTHFDSSNSLILDFDVDPPPELTDRLQELSFMEDGVLVFKRSVDGVTRCLKSHTINASSASEYLILVDGLINDVPFLERQKLDCDGLYLYAVNKPELDSENALDKLKDLGIGIIQKISITPIRNLPFNWDGDGYGEWMIGEDVVFKIETSHPFDRFVAILDQTNSQEFDTEHEKVGFVRLSNLTEGIHNLSIEVKEFVGWERDVASIDVEIHISETKPESPQPFVSQLTPSDDLDLFWENESELMLYGPEEVPYVVGFTFDAGQASEATYKIHESQFPFKRDSWLRDFDKFRKNYFARYLDSRSADLAVSSSNLGNYSHHLSRDLKPLRWQTKHQNRNIQIKLINDHSTSEEDEDIDSDDLNDSETHSPRVYLFAFDKPWEPVSLDRDFLTYTDIPENGGLLVARFDMLTDQIVVERPAVKLGEFEVVEGVYENENKSTNDLVLLIRLIGWWRSARSCIQSSFRKNMALRELKRYFIHSFLSSNWSQLEGKLESTSSSYSRTVLWDRLFRDIRGESVERFLLSLTPTGKMGESKRAVYDFLIQNKVISIGVNRFEKWIRLLNEPEHPEIQCMNEKDLVTLLDEVRKHNSAAKLIRISHIIESRLSG